MYPLATQTTQPELNRLNASRSRASLRLARERGETTNNVERVSLERSTGAQTGKNGPSGAGRSISSQSPINTAVGDMTVAVFVNL
jgi:hypothetical protein